MSGRNGMKGLVPSQPGDESFADAFDRMALEMPIPVVAVPIAPFGVPMTTDRFSTVIGCAGCGLGAEPHGPDCPVKNDIVDPAIWQPLMDLLDRQPPLVEDDQFEDPEPLV